MYNKKYYFLFLLLFLAFPVFSQKNECLVKKIKFFRADVIKDSTKNYANDTSYFKSVEFFYENKQIMHCVIKRKFTYPAEPKAEEKIIFVRKNNKDNNHIWAISEKDTLGIWIFNAKNELIKFEKQGYDTERKIWNITYEKDKVVVENKYSTSLPPSFVKMLLKENEIQIIGRAISDGEDERIGTDPQRQACTLDNKKNPFYFQKELNIIEKVTAFVSFLSPKNVLENYFLYATMGMFRHHTSKYDYNTQGYPVSQTVYDYNHWRGEGKPILNGKTFFEYICE